MIIKIILSFLIIGLSTAAGFFYSEGFKKRTDQLNELARSINQFQNELIYTHTALPEILSNISKKSKYPISCIFENIASILNTNEVDNVYSAFEKAFTENRKNLSIDENDINIMLDMAKTIGESDIDGHKRIFQLTLNNLKKQIEKSEEAANKNVKMYRYLGFTIGTTVVIMLI